MSGEPIALLDALIVQQQAKVLSLARTLVPDISAEDIRNPHDFPVLRRSDVFNFEDGILAGLLSARMALAADPGCRGPGRRGVQVKN